MTPEHPARGGRRGRRIRLAAVVTAATLVVLWVAKDAIARAVVTGGVRVITGLSARIGRLHVMIPGAAVQVMDLRVFNPPGFSEEAMLDMPELLVDPRWSSLLTGTIHLQEIRLHVRELVVVKNAEGDVNLHALRSVREQRGRQPVSTGRSASRIDTLELRIDQLVYKDYTTGGSPRIQTYPIHLHRRYGPVDDLQVVASLIVVEALGRTAVARLAGLDLAGLQGDLLQVLRGATTLGWETLGTVAARGTAVGTKAAETASGTTKRVLKTLGLGGE